jgi:DNA invertase Pin-like site-specific DNA recombinase
VFRDTPVRRTIALIDRPSARWRRQISAQSPTFITPDQVPGRGSRFNFRHGGQSSGSADTSGSADKNEQVQKLIAEYQAGATVYQLGERFGISRQTVGKILKRQGVTMRMQGLTPEQIEEAVRLYEGGWSLARIGTKLKVDAGTVHARLRERGVRMRDTHGRPQ